jgi:hypothetical protein
MRAIPVFSKELSKKLEAPRRAPVSSRTHGFDVEKSIPSVRWELGFGAVKLPFLHIELPLLAFFFLAPILFVIVRAYTLVHLVFLTDKAKRFHQALYRQIGDNKTLPTEARGRNAAIRAALRRQLPSNIFVQFLAGPSDVRDSAFGYLSDTLLWRSGRGGAGDLAAVKLPDSPDQWLPVWHFGDDRVLSWDDKAYRSLRDRLEFLPPEDLRDMEEFFPPGCLRDQALDRIGTLDCTNPDKTLESCDPSNPPPPEAAAWRKALNGANVDREAYAEALVKALRELVCSGGGDSVYVVLGPGFQSRLPAAGPAASGLIGELISKDGTNCLVAAALTDADRANLLGIKREIEEADK